MRPRTAVDWALVAVVTVLVVLRLVVGLQDAREGRFIPTVLTPSVPALLEQEGVP